MDCSKITAGYVQDCEKVAKGGTGSKVFLFNLADIDKTDDDSGAEYIHDIILKEGKKGVIYESFDNSTEGTATLNKGAYISNYDHQITLRLFSKSEEARAFIGQIKQARVVAVVESRNAGTNGFNYEVYGFESGLVLSENAISTTLTDGVAYSLVLKSDDTSKENYIPRIVEMTEANLTALCQSA